MSSGRNGENLHSLLLLFMLIVICVFAGSCSWFKTQVPFKHHYLLTYTMPEPIANGKYPIAVRVKDFSISPTYNRSQLVFRYSPHELEYYNFRLWTDRPNLMISDLIRQTIAASGLFSSVTRKIGDKSPDFTFSGDIHAIEELDSDEQWFAHLAISFNLHRFSDDVVVWNYSFDERRPVLVKDPRIVVRTLSEILQNQMSLILGELDRAMPALLEQTEVLPGTSSPGQSLPGVTQPPDKEPALGTADDPDPDSTAVQAESAMPAQETSTTKDGIIGPQQSVWLDSPQMLADTTTIPFGKGALFVPALSSPDREPVVIVKLGAERLVSTTGVRIPLEPGVYSLRIGSGTLEQTTSLRARVVEGRITVIEPTWSALDVRVVDDHFIPFRGTYELIAIPSREEFGIGFGADEELAEETKVWLLPEGLYKIIQAGGTYRDRVNFATVYIKSGELTVFTLVLDRDSGNFLGAGIIEEEEGSAISKRWKFRALIGGDVLFMNQTDSSSGELEGWTYTGNLFFDSVASFRQGPHQFNFRTEIEEGLVKRPDEEAQTLNDRLYFHSIYTYYLMERFGPYVRAGVETSLTNRYYYFDEQMQHRAIIHEIDTPKGTVREDIDYIKTAEPFSPVQLKSGLGGNIKLLTTQYIDTDIRIGYGGRQYFARDYLSLVSKTEDEVTFRRLDDNTVHGIETSLVTIARFTRYAGWSLEIDSLLPLDDPDEHIYNVRSIISLRLVSFASLNYKLDINRDPNINEIHPTTVQHQFFVRFSYTLL